MGKGSELSPAVVVVVIVLVVAIAGFLLWRGTGGKAKARVDPNVMKQAYQHSVQGSEGARGPRPAPGQGMPGQ